jgi:hypothetical protein
MASASLSGEVPAGAFLSKSIPEAAKLYLSIVKKKQSTREIAEALKAGGIESTSSNFVGIVHAILDRSRKAGGEFLKMGKGYWALAEWYPAGFRNSHAASAKPKKKKAKAKAKARVSEPKTDATQEPKAPPAEKGTASARIAEVLRSAPEGRTSEQVAKAIGMHPKVTAMTLGRMLKAGMVVKTDAGIYHPKVQQMPKAG